MTYNQNDVVTPINPEEVTHLLNSLQEVAANGLDPVYDDAQDWLTDFSMDFYWGFRNVLQTIYLVENHSDLLTEVSDKIGFDMVADFTNSYDTNDAGAEMVHCGEIQVVVCKTTRLMEGDTDNINEYLVYQKDNPTKSAVIPAEDIEYLV